MVRSIDVYIYVYGEERVYSITVTTWDNNSRIYRKYTNTTDD